MKIVISYLYFMLVSIPIAVIVMTSLHVGFLFYDTYKFIRNK